MDMHNRIIDIMLRECAADTITTNITRARTRIIPHMDRTVTALMLTSSPIMERTTEEAIGGNLIGQITGPSISRRIKSDVNLSFLLTSTTLPMPPFRLRYKTRLRKTGLTAAQLDLMYPNSEF